MPSRAELELLKILSQKDAGYLEEGRLWQKFKAMVGVTPGSLPLTLEFDKEFVNNFGFETAAKSDVNVGSDPAEIDKVLASVDLTGDRTVKSYEEMANIIHDIAKAIAYGSTSLFTGDDRDDFIAYHAIGSLLNDAALGRDYPIKNAAKLVATDVHNAMENLKGRLMYAREKFAPEKEKQQVKKRDRELAFAESAFDLRGCAKLLEAINEALRQSGPALEFAKPGTVMWDDIAGKTKQDGGGGVYKVITTLSSGGGISGKPSFVTKVYRPAKAGENIFDLDPVEAVKTEGSSWDPDGEAEEIHEKMIIKYGGRAPEHYKKLLDQGSGKRL